MPFDDAQDDDDGEIRIIKSETQFGEPFVFLARVYLSSSKPYKACADGDEAKTVDEIRLALEKPVLAHDDVDL